MERLPDRAGRADRRPRAAVPAPAALAATAAILACLALFAPAGLAAGWDPWARPGPPPRGPAVAAAGAARAEIAARLGARAGRLARDGSPSLQQARLAGRAAPAALHAVVLMCDFADSLLYGRHGQVPGDFPPPAQSEFYYAAHDSLYFDHLMQDVASYFDAASGGRFAWTWQIHGRVVNLPHGMAWYGDHPEEGERPVSLAADVVAAVDDEIDFSRFDTVVLIHAGAGEETDILDDSPEQIYSTYLGPEDFAAAARDSVIDQPYLPSDDFPAGTGITQVLLLPETEYQDRVQNQGGFFGSLGVYCFEVGLRLGMLSLSDFTPAGRPDSQGIGEFGLMGYGLFVGAGLIPCQPSAFNKVLMGWMDPYPVDADAGASWSLTPAEQPAEPLACARVEISGREYWLLEYRLQDPDGDVVFSWADDKNGDGIPNFTRRDDPTFVPRAFVDFFDPAVHVRETLAGAEWDFFMSENPARAPGVKGAGSGVYIWHVDEGVIREAFDAEGTLFNADPARKAVDLEEADGIQDLDRAAASPYMLGGDADSFRGEGSRPYGPDLLVGTAFGPATRPGSESAGGAWTGTLIDSFSDVVVDSVGTPPALIDYAATMSFRVGRVGAAAGPSPAAEADLPDVDLAGSHLLAVDLDGGADGRLELVLAGSGGSLWALTPELRERVDHDGNPATLAPLAVATGADAAPVVWNGPPAAGDLDGNGRPEIVATAAGGVYAFAGDGTPLRPDAGPAHGLLAALTGCRLPPVLLPLGSPQAPFSPATPVLVCVVEEEAGAARARFLDAAGADAFPPLALPCLPAAPPVLAAGTLMFAGEGPDGGAPRLALARWAPGGGGAVALGEEPLAFLPSALSPLGGTVDGRTFLVVPGRDGTQSLWWEGAPAAGTARLEIWPGGLRLDSPPAPGLAAVSGGRLLQVTSAGHPRTGWPWTPEPDAGVAPAGRAAAALRPAGPAGDVLFAAADGRLWLLDDLGRPRPGWPLAGPGEPSGTPLLLDLDGDGSLEIVAAGSFERIVGVEDGGGDLVGRPLSRLAVWSGLPGGPPAAGAWPMWRGDPWRTGATDRPLALADPAGEAVLAQGPLCYPNPLRQDVLRVRGLLRRAAAVAVTIYNLEGEEVAAAGPIGCDGGEAFELAVPLPGVASGLYVCRLAVEEANRRTVAAAPFAVVR